MRRLNHTGFLSIIPQIVNSLPTLKYNLLSSVCSRLSRCMFSLNNLARPSPAPPLATWNERTVPSRSTIATMARLFFRPRDPLGVGTATALREIHTAFSVVCRHRFRQLQRSCLHRPVAQGHPNRIASRIRWQINHADFYVDLQACVGSDARSCPSLLEHKQRRMPVAHKRSGIWLNSITLLGGDGEILVAVSSALDFNPIVDYIPPIPPSYRGVSVSASSDAGRGAVAGE